MSNIFLEFISAIVISYFLSVLILSIIECCTEDCENNDKKSKKATLILTISILIPIFLLDLKYIVTINSLHDLINTSSNITELRETINLEQDYYEE